MIWFFVIVVIIVVAAGGVWWLQHYFQTRIKNLDAQVEAIDVGALSSQIRSIEQLKLTGDSLATFSKWERAFDQLNDDDLADLQKILLDLEDQAKRFRFDHAQKIAKVLEAKIDTARQQYDLISQALQDIRHDEADNRSKMLQLRDDYQVSRKTILAKSFVFGDAQPALEQQLQQLAELFQKIDQINNDGDHQAAKSEIKQLSDEMAALRRQVKELPPLVNEQVNEFPAQINEIEHGYRQLTTAHYVFTDDIPGMVEDVNEKMADANTALKSLDVDATEAANSEIEAEIDKMYAIMEKEMQARKRVDAAAPDLRQFIDHALRQNRELQTELDHLNQSYTLNHNEIKIAKDLKTQLDSIDANYIKDT
ncbi:septation ring formation regulator EzrA, partial [Lacticaseibacillus paracasei]